MSIQPYNSVGGFSVGTGNSVVIDSARGFVGLGATFSGNISAPNIVNSFNGSTGAVTYAPPLATTSVTGVASFNSSDFTVSTGAVSLTSVARTNTANTFSERQIFTTGITGNLSLNSNKITDLLTPTNTFDAANKYYVDNIAAGLNYHPNCHVATTVALGATYDNGLSGVGAYLEALANGFIGQIDGHTADANDRVLVKNQTSTVENGIYFVSLTGSASQKWKLIRATDSDNSIPGQVAGGDTVYVEMGITNGGAGFVLIGTSGVGLTLGTSPIVWTQYTGVDVTTAGNGLSKSGNTLNVNVDDSTIQIVGDTLQLVNSSVSVNAGTGLGGGGSVALGSSVTLSNTGVLSFNGSTGNVIGVQSFNGSTGAVTYAPPLATTSVTGVASFNSSDFTVSSGAVSLSNVARTNSANTFTGLQTLNAGLTTQSLFVSQGATFNGNVAINGNLTVGDAVADIITLPSGQIVKTYTSTTTSVSQFTLASASTTSYTCADIIVQAEKGDGGTGTLGVLSTRFMLSSLLDGTISHTQYATVSVGDSVATFTITSVDLGVGIYEWRLRATPASSTTTTFRVYTVLSPTVGGLGA